MTALTVVEWESDLPMAGPAVSPFDIRKHRKSDSAFLGSGEYFGMAEFTAAPKGMLFVRKLNRVNPRVTCLDGEILTGFHCRFFGGETFHKIDRFDDPRFLRRLPIHTVITFREFRSKLPVLIFPCALLAEGVAPIAALLILGIGAGSEDGFSLKQLAAIVAGTAIETFAVRARADTSGLRLHGKADIYMADPACEHGPVKPMIKYDGTGPNRRVIIKNHLAVVGGVRWTLR